MCNMYVKFIIPHDRIMQWQNYFYYQEINTLCYNYHLPHQSFKG